mmetsp:Transcript_55771/g.143715  ORF Transcript_55771/g.143715 Transcript_55771/m.143715 type:complete len:219 (+) Transcript_55771:89-745(+)
MTMLGRLKQALGHFKGGKEQRVASLTRWRRPGRKAGAVAPSTSDDMFLAVVTPSPPCSGGTAQERTRSPCCGRVPSGESLGATGSASVPVSLYSMDKRRSLKDTLSLSLTLGPRCTVASLANAHCDFVINDYRDEAMSEGCDSTRASSPTRSRSRGCASTGTSSPTRSRSRTGWPQSGSSSAGSGEDWTLSENDGALAEPPKKAVKTSSAAECPGIVR